MPTLSLSPRDRPTIPNSSTDNNKLTTPGHCTQACTIALATVLPLIAIFIILTVIYFAWGQRYLTRRRHEREEKLRTREKLEDPESSVASSDVGSLSGDVLGLSEDTSREEVEGRRERQGIEKREEEGRGDEHVLAMIHARP